MPTRTGLARIVEHGGMYTMLDQGLMTARLAAFGAARAAEANEKSATDENRLTVEAAGKLREMVKNFFYKLVDKRGYLIHSELMAYITEPGKGNGVAYDEGADASPSIPAAFTFVGQFIDHDLTLNAINLTENEAGIVVQDKASPIIDLDSVYGIRLKDAVPNGDVNSEAYKGFKKVFDKVFDKEGKFRLKKVGNGYDLPREDDGMGGLAAVIFDPRNDENQLILQIHILVERFHNKLIEKGILKDKIKKLQNPKDPIQIAECVRNEVVATWQSFVLNDYMPAIIRNEVFTYVIEQIHKKATDPAKPEEQYGKLKHKPYRNLVTGRNEIRMPHEFAIGFRFGHSQLRPFYVLNKNSVVILFKDARASENIPIDVTPPVTISGKDDLRGNRKLESKHVIDWTIFFPLPTTPLKENTQSLRIDGKVTARVFNLPESAIPDDIKYIGNLTHRNLIRSSQIGIVSGEELAEFYDLGSADILKPAEVLGGDAGRRAAEELFELDSTSEDKRKFKTPLWYYLLKEAEVQSDRGEQLGKVGSRLIAEVLMGALYYGNDFPIDDNWISSAIKPAKPRQYGSIKLKDSITLRNIIDFVNS